MPDNSRFVHVTNPDEPVPLATVLQEQSQLRVLSLDGSFRFLLSEWQLNEDSTQDRIQRIASCVTKLEFLACYRHILTLDGTLNVQSLQCGHSRTAERSPAPTKIQWQQRSHQFLMVRGSTSDSSEPQQDCYRHRVLCGNDPHPGSCGARHKLTRI